MPFGNGSLCDVCGQKAVMRLTRKGARGTQIVIKTKTASTCMDHVSHVVMFLTVQDVTIDEETLLTRKTVNPEDVDITITVMAF